jgi:hypothetical protein
VRDDTDIERNWQACRKRNPCAAGLAPQQTLAGVLNFHNIESWKRSGTYDCALKALHGDSPQQVQTGVTTTFGGATRMKSGFSGQHEPRDPDADESDLRDVAPGAAVGPAPRASAIICARSISPDNSRSA